MTPDTARLIAWLFWLCTAYGLSAQNALYNGGRIRIHIEGQLGFHTHLINDTPFEKNHGLAGFYGNSPLFVSGAMAPEFYDLEVANPAGLDLESGVVVSNNINFIFGNIRTPRNRPDIYKTLTEDAFFTGDTDSSKVDGYVVVTGIQQATFPVGDATQLRPLDLYSAEVNPFVKCAYFFENPNSPSTFRPFPTERREAPLAGVSEREFWRLEGGMPCTILLSWNDRSGLGNLTSELASVTLAGWSKLLGKWIRLGNGSPQGTLSSGSIQSQTFIPDAYEVITLGTVVQVPEHLLPDNFLLTPDGDGINDRLHIPGLELSPDNSLKIFDRNGLLVFEKRSYANDFTGFANVTGPLINREQGLPEGIYYYLIILKDLDLKHQGFLYIER